MSDILKDFQSGNKNMYIALDTHFGEMDIEGLYFIKESKTALWTSKTAALNYLRRHNLLDNFRIMEISYVTLDEFTQKLPYEKAKRFQFIIMP